MKYVLVSLFVVLAVVSFLLSNTVEQGNNKQHNNRPITDLPWQIDVLPDGATRVFGITIGQTTLAEAIDQLGDEDMRLAIIAAPLEAGSLESYYSNYSAGPITGKLILVMDVAHDMLAQWRERALQDGGKRLYRLHPDDLPVAHQAAVKLISFMPSFNLDEDIVKSRFGLPDEVIQIDGQQHYLYRKKGLDLILDADGKEALHYLLPGDFIIHRARLQQTPSNK